MNLDQKGTQEVEATIPTNEFTLVMPGLSKLNFEIHSYSITSGQPWKGIFKIECNDEGCTMFVEAGRKGSEETARWFKEAIAVSSSQPGSAIGTDSFDALPDKLNFAFKGTMSFHHQEKTYTGNDIVIAQGHNARSRNNWWIGGPNMSIIAAVPGFMAGIAQNFKPKPGIIPVAKVTFMTSIGNVSSMQVGVIGV